MSITRTARVSAESSLGVLSGSCPETGNSEVSVDQNFPAASTNVAITLAFTVANVQYCFLLSDVDMTLKTNSSGSPANTINLKAGRPYRWCISDGYNALLFTVNVTSGFVTCTSAGRLRIYVLTG